jgi:hypothetical protein
MTDYNYYLVDCSGRSGALKVEEARFIRGEDVLGFLWDEYQKYCATEKKCMACTIKWSKEQGRDSEERLLELLKERTTKDHWYDHQVKCYPIAQDGSIVKDHSVMREIWLSYEGEAQTQ